MLHLDIKRKNIKKINKKRISQNKQQGDYGYKN